ncbi:hypothetical protein [Mucilaginibacter sp. OK098]|uniref:hypothetical protein n=1 Tax=Mucilaginibacter sp. OK098 TaxID=1855297 RepID=UPI00116132A2|nr:hypothetical protein [Mucilaginibacter sp. OK098]
MNIGIRKGVVMPAVKKSEKENSFYDNAIISDKVKDRSNDPYFVKKAEEAKAFLHKHPLPEHLKK